MAPPERASLAQPSRCTAWARGSIRAPARTEPAPASLDRVEVTRPPRKRAGRRGRGGVGGGEVRWKKSLQHTRERRETEGVRGAVCGGGRVTAPVAPAP
eukprot:scaffold21397_cov127-Isochrysis_galbana.AAC.2